MVIHGSSAVPGHLVDQINAHGGRMDNAVGILDEDIRKAAHFSVCKVNIDTDLRLAVTGALRQFFADQPGEFEPMSYLACARNAVSGLVQFKNDLLNSAHRAALFTGQEQG